MEATKQSQYMNPDLDDAQTEPDDVPLSASHRLQTRFSWGNKNRNNLPPHAKTSNTVYQNNGTQHHNNNNNNHIDSD